LADIRLWVEAAAVLGLASSVAGGVTIVPLLSFVSLYETIAAVAIPLSSIPVAARYRKFFLSIALPPGDMAPALPQSADRAVRSYVALKATIINASDSVLPYQSGPLTLTNDG
jgi:hypothetical protein